MSLVILLVLALLCAASVLSLRLFRIDSSISLSLPDSIERREAASAHARFPDLPLVLLSLPVSEVFSPGALERLVSLAHALKELGRDAGGTTWKVLSPLDAGSVTKQGESLVTEPLVTAGTLDPAKVRMRVEASPLLHRLFVAPDAKAWTLLLETDIGGEELLARIDKLKVEFPEVLVSGSPYYLALNGRTLAREFVPLVVASATLLVLAVILLFGEFIPAVIAAVFSLLPTLLLLGFFVLTGKAMRLEFVLAPALTLCLSTSYVTQFHQGWIHLGRDVRAALGARGRMILANGSAAILGFAILLASPLRELRELSLYCIAGALFGLLTTLLGLPSALILVGKGGTRGAVPARQTGRSPFLLHGSPPSEGARGPRILAWGAAAALLCLLASSVGAGVGIADQFAPGTRERMEIEGFDAAHRSSGSAAVIADSGEEFGVASLDFYAAMEGFESDLVSMRGVTNAAGYTDLVGEALAGWEGRTGVLKPRSDREIAEILELLASTANADLEGNFVDSSRGAARLSLTLAEDFTPMRDMQRLRAEAAESAKRHGLRARLFWTGESVDRADAESSFMEGQAQGNVLFFVVLLLALGLLFRSARKAATLALGPALGMAAALAAMAFGGWRFSFVDSIAMAAIAGTSMDLALLLALRSWSAEAKTVALRTAVLEAIGLAPLLFCSSFLVARATAVCIVGIGVSLLAALHLAPAIWPSDESH